MKGKTLGEDGAENSPDCLDLSILRKPISTSITGFNEARKAYENGTDEMRQLLANECDIVYECKVCRNIFRSLANFISHKRVYCRQKFNASQHFHFPSNGFINQDISTIVQTEQEYTNYSVKDKPPEQVSKDLSSIIERLTAKKNVDRVMKLTDFYDRVNHKLTQNEVMQKNHVVQLDATGSDVAVYQTLKETEVDSIKTEVEEVRSMLMDNKTVLGPDGKAIRMEDLAPVPAVAAFDDLDAVPEQVISCDICNVKFATEKTLKLHLEAKHINSTYVYPCPACTQTFLVPAAVIRHLSNDHKKSLKRIRLMRDTIYKRRVRMDEVHVKGPSRELVRLQTDRERQEADNKAWIENVENYDVTQSMCTYCGKTFERRAVLTTHLANCRKKQRSATVTSGMMRRMAVKVEKPKKSVVEAMKEMSLGGQQDDNSNSFDSCMTNVSGNIIQSNLHNKLNASIEAVDSDTNSNCNAFNCNANENVPVRKRKRKKTAKVADEQPPQQPTEQQPSPEEVYWSMDEGGELSMKKPCLPPPAPPSVSPNSKDKKQEEKKQEENLPECDICNKTFVTKSNLKRHNVMFHYFKNRFLCTLCDFGANKKLELISHLGVKHSIMGDKHVVKEFIKLAKENRELPMEDDSPTKTTPTISSKSLPTSLCPSPLMVEEPVEESSNSSSMPEVGPKKRGRPKGSKKSKSPPEITPHRKIPREEEKTPKKHTNDAAPKRPIRNRIKPVNKDFVYDLSHLLKKDSDIFRTLYMDQQHQTVKKRKNNTQPDVEKPKVPQNTTPIKEEQQPVIADENYKIEKVKGAAFTMARNEVAQHAATLARIPPAVERLPGVFQARSPEEEPKNFSWGDKVFKKVHQKRSIKQPRRVSVDNVIRGAKKQRRRKHSTPVLQVRSPEYRVDETKAHDAKKEEPKRHTEKDFQEFLLANLKDCSPAEDSLFGASPLSFTNSNGKRITLLERLAENKNRKIDSVHRLSNPFEDDSSDEY
uniref:C2H2-type domain-containing protein n=1 Tax=Nyssomyia neivai TaxID=330878 RepID=A0A1L8DCH8_9DIPT